MTQWDNYRQSLRWHLANDSLDNFLQWSTIQATMFVGNAPYINDEYQSLIGEGVIRYWPIIESWVGKPEPYNDWTSGNLIHQMYHLKQWLDLTKQDIFKMKSIVEIGAGYGAMALICHRLGFKGRYYIIDFPELIEIQKHYLDKTVGDKNIVCIKSSDMEWQPARLSCDLLIASHSLGEMPIPEREKLLSQVATKEYLFASSYEYEGVDNAAWFQQFAGSTVGVDWKFYPHRWQENAFYMVGVEL